MIKNQWAASSHLFPVQAGILHNGVQILISQLGVRFGVILPQNFLLYVEYDQVFCPSPQVSQGALRTLDKAAGLVSPANLARVCCTPSSITVREDNKAGSSVHSWVSPLVPCKFLRIVLQLSPYCSLLENTSLMPSQRNKSRYSNSEEGKQNKTKTALCLRANLPHACGLAAV